jgi:hypothetical protein
MAAETISFIEEYAKPEKKEPEAEKKEEKPAEAPKAEDSKAPEELTEADRKR